MTEALALLARVAPFREASPALQSQLAHAGFWQTFAAGQVLFLQHDNANSVFVLERGAVKLYAHNPTLNREITVAVHGAHQSLGLLAVCLQTSRHTLGCDALEEVRAFCLPHKTLQQALSDTGFAQACLHELALRQSKLQERFADVALYGIAQRLARYLSQHDTTEGHVLPSNSELASLLGTVPELVSRKLGEFYRQGFIRLERRRVFVVDAAALREL